MSLSAASYYVSESGGAVLVTVNLPAPVSFPVRVYFQTTDNTAQFSSNYEAMYQYLELPAGHIQRMVEIPIIDDLSLEADEKINVRLLNPFNAVLGSLNEAIVTIEDNDQFVAFSAAAFYVQESGGTATITVSLVGSVSHPVSVYYSTGTGTATAGSDYAAFSGQVTIPAGQTAASFTVGIFDDEEYDPGELLSLTFFSASGATLGSATTATLTIVDDDDAPPPEVSFFARRTRPPRPPERSLSVRSSAGPFPSRSPFTSRRSMARRRPGLTMGHKAAYSPSQRRNRLDIRPSADRRFRRRADGRFLRAPVEFHERNARPGPDDRHSARRRRAGLGCRRQVCATAHHRG